MTTAHADLPPYDPQRIVNAPFPEKVRLACRTWANSSPNRPSVMALYWAKYFFVLIGAWAFWCSFNAGYPGFTAIGDWAFSNEAFKKAMVWSMCWELFGFGCGWGPMNARFDKWFGGYRHFARVGTIKLPLFRGVPLIGGDTRNLLDVGLYVLNQVLLLRILVAPEVTAELLLPCFVLVAVNGVLDKTLMLVARYEHYWVVMGAMTFAMANDLWISGAKIVWSFIWIWAGVSKWNSHFPSVIMFMMNNGPFFPKFLKKSLFTSFPDDLRPSRFASFMAAFGHVSEVSIPFILLLAAQTGNEWILLVEGFPGLAVLDRDEFIGDVAAQLSALVNVIYGLLALSLVIAMIGVANTLSLSVHERTRELGLLRAVGMTRGQLKSAIRWEAVLIAVLGTLVGLAVGLIISYALIKALSGFGLSTFKVPWLTLLIQVVVAAGFAVVASLRTARRAGKLDILAAIATE